MAAIRRFFFDDGSSRKRWQIHTRGKKLIIQYGRIGASLRSTDKMFESPKAARDAAASAVAAKLDSGYVEVAPSLLRLKRPSRLRLATPASIRALEKAIHATLPPEYRRFLRTQNGGRPDPGFIPIPGVPHIENVSIGFIYGLYASERPGQSLSWGIRTHCPCLPNGHLPIAYGSDVFTLSLRKKAGCVFFWDHETDEIDDDDKFLESAGHVLAGSFDEFLTRIALFSSQGR